VLGVLLVGSWARGDALTGAIVDLEVLVRSGPEITVLERRVGESTNQPVVGIHLMDEAAWMARLRHRPAALYSFRDGRVLFQRDDALGQLAAEARRRWGEFRWSQAEVAATLQEIESARLKVRAAYEVGDSLRAAVLLSTTLWRTLQGLWMVNHLPMPPAGGVTAHLDDLEHTPPDFRAELRELLLGGSLTSGLRVMDWVADELTALSSV
jgi:hypothetical protein